jgi:hypothetical protein
LTHAHSIEAGKQHGIGTQVIIVHAEWKLVHCREAYPLIARIHTAWKNAQCMESCRHLGSRNTFMETSAMEACTLHRSRHTAWKQAQCIEASILHGSKQSTLLASRHTAW